LSAVAEQPAAEAVKPPAARRTGVLASAAARGTAHKDELEVCGVCGYVTGCVAAVVAVENDVVAAENGVVVAVENVVVVDGREGGQRMGRVGGIAMWCASDAVQRLGPATSQGESWAACG
jgi:hypothetical protein